jgi:alkanesulfonate monooxygenase SsuD/methylene tetrahydromethanopterin reductase-like flavin-dependent oxidoreductase (luciferase family)
MGLGSSSQTMMGGWHGLPLDKPVTRVKETAIMVRSMLKGEKSEFDLETMSSHGYRQYPMENPPPIYIAALRSNMIEMAAEVGDGVIFNLWPKRALAKMMEHVKIGAKRAGKDWRDVEIVNRAMVLVTDDKAEARNRFRGRLPVLRNAGGTTSFLRGLATKMRPKRSTRGGPRKTARKPVVH